MKLINGRHKTKHVVKILSGPRKNTVLLFDTNEAANAECFHLADNGICAVHRTPLFEER